MSDYGAIEVVIHPQSVVHSAVRFVDGSLKAQLGTPDMRLPIQYALTHPIDCRHRRAARPAGDGRLDFRAPDEAVSRPSGSPGGRPQGPRASAALIAADEVAVARFLDGTLGFTGIPALLEAAVERYGRAGSSEPDVDELVALERDVRAAVRDRGRSERPRDRVHPVADHGRPVRPRLGVLVIIHEIGHFASARLAVSASSSSASASRRARRCCGTRARRSTRSTGCRSAAS
jgi:hypothetical protein